MVVIEAQRTTQVWFRMKDSNIFKQFKKEGPDLVLHVERKDINLFFFCLGRDSG